MLEKRILAGTWKIGERLPREEELAKEFGCCCGTINKALTRLSHEGLVERRTRSGTRVKNTVPYVPPVSTIDLNALAFICPTEEHEGIWRIARGFQAAARGSDQRILVLSSSVNVQKEAETIGRLSEFNVRGALIYPVISKPEDLLFFSNMVLSSPFPVVLVEMNLPGIGRPFVSGNGFDCGQVLTSHLISKGIKKIGFLTDYSWTQSMRDRHMGYRSAMMEANLEVQDSWVLCEYSMHPNFADPVALSLDLAEKYMATNPDLEGVVCGTSFMAEACLIIARKIGLDVPDQFKIVGTDSFSNSQSLQLTSYQLPYEEMGQVSFNLLHEALSGHVLDPVELQIKGKLLVGQTS